MNWNIGTHQSHRQYSLLLVCIILSYCFYCLPRVNHWALKRRRQILRTRMLRSVCTKHMKAHPEVDSQHMNMHIVWLSERLFWICIFIVTGIQRYSICKICIVSSVTIMHILQICIVTPSAQYAYFLNMHSHAILNMHIFMHIRCIFLTAIPDTNIDL